MSKESVGNVTRFVSMSFSKEFLSYNSSKRSGEDNRVRSSSHQSHLFLFLSITRFFPLQP